jgi:hypothetical protein
MKDNIYRIEMAKVEIPVPVEKLKSGTKWISYGEKNDYPNYLLSLYNTSPKLQSMASSLAEFIQGNGFDITNEQIKKFVDNQYNEEDLNEILEKIALDIVVYGAYTLNIIWSRDGKSIAQIKYIDVAKFRFAEEIEYDDEYGCQYGYISKDWTNPRKFIPVKYQMFDGIDKTEKSQILYVYKYSPSMGYYAAPIWASVATWAQLDNQVALFHLNSALNSYTPNLHINVASGTPEPEEQKRFKNQLDNEYQGANNASRVILSFSEGQENATSITPINIDSSDERFKLQHEHIIQNMLLSFKSTSPELMGIMTPAGLSSSPDLEQALRVYQVKVIDGFQKVIEKSMTWLSSYNGVTEPITINEYKIINSQIIE